MLKLYNKSSSHRMFLNLMDSLKIKKKDEDAVSVVKNHGILRVLSPEQLGQFVHHVTPLMTSKETVRNILKYTTGFLGSSRYHRYLSEEDTRYFIDKTIHFFDSPDELKALPLDRSELRYARRAMKTQARSGRPGRAETTNDSSSADGRFASSNKKGRLDCLRGWLGLCKKTNTSE